MRSMVCAFALPIPICAAVSRRRARPRPRRHICMGPGGENDESGMTAREIEIAAKIDMLRRQRKLPSQKAVGNTNTQAEAVQEAQIDDNRGEQLFAKDAPEAAGDGSEELFASTIAEGEKLFGTTPKPCVPVSPTESDYKPKVSTWGVFQRPANISRAYGGGRKVPLGGKQLYSEETKEYDARVAEKLAKYRGGSLEEAALEAEHADDIRAAIKQAERIALRGDAYEATRLLRRYIEYATARTRLGGELRLALALACEDAGRRSEAREIYSELLRTNKFNEIRQKVKQLNSGFADMEKMRITDGATDADGQLGFRSADFYIPDIAPYDRRRVLGTGIPLPEMTDEERRRETASLFATLVALLGVPAVAVLLLRSMI